MDADKLAKVLAMVDSDHHGEAVSALRAARSMLAREGMTFRDLADSLRSGNPSAEPEAGSTTTAYGARFDEDAADDDDDASIITPSFYASSHPPGPAEPDEPAPASPEDDPGPVAPDAQHTRWLFEQLDEMEQEVLRLRRQNERQQKTAKRQQDEVERWRKLARDTAEQLWDMGRALEQHTASRHLLPSARWQELIDFLRDPLRSLLSDQEIGHRLGLASHRVALWRRRLQAIAATAMTAGRPGQRAPTLGPRPKKPARPRPRSHRPSPRRPL